MPIEKIIDKIKQGIKERNNILKGRINPRPIRSPKSEPQHHKESKEKLNFDLLKLLGTLAIIYVAWHFLFDYSQEEYSSCVDDCVSDMSSCAFDSTVYDKNRNEFIPQSEFDSCQADLDSCVSDCQP
jgi:hypothetical protein